jgi:hypothetical protein
MSDELGCECATLRLERDALRAEVERLKKELDSCALVINDMGVEVARLQRMERAAKAWADGWMKCPGDIVARRILSGLGYDGKQVE